MSVNGTNWLNILIVLVVLIVIIIIIFKLLNVALGIAPIQEFSNTNEKFMLDSLIIRS